MPITQHNRRSFLSSIAILSVGSVFGSTIKHFSPAAFNSINDLQKNWAEFWKKSGGQVFNGSADLNGNNNKGTKGHRYQYGEIIYFPKENILAQPTWIFWDNDLSKPADLAVSLFENKEPFKKIICFNRFEMDALYLVSKEADTEQLLLASFNNSKHNTGSSTGIIKTKTNIHKNVQIQDISYYKGRVLVFQDKLIHHI